MPRKSKCIPCMSPDIKQIIRDHSKDLVLIEEVNAVPDCPEPGQLQFCLIKKRSPSPYQAFIKQCLATKPLKGKPFGEAGKYLKECAIEWRKRSGANTK